MWCEDGLLRCTSPAWLSPKHSVKPGPSVFNRVTSDKKTKMHPMHQVRVVCVTVMGRCSFVWRRTFCFYYLHAPYVAAVGGGFCVRNKRIWYCGDGRALRKSPPGSKRWVFHRLHRVTLRAAFSTLTTRNKIDSLSLCCGLVPLAGKAL